MVRRRLTVKRIDPWSVLKFGAVANLVLLAIGLLVAWVAWFVIERLNIVDQVCGIATDVGFTQCGVNAGNLFRALILLGLLWVVVQTAVLVFLSFLHNLIADLTGGLVLSVIDDTPGAAARGEAPRRVTTASTPPAADDRHSGVPTRAVPADRGAGVPGPQHPVGTGNVDTRAERTHADAGEELFRDR